MRRRRRGRAHTTVPFLQPHTNRDSNNPALTQQLSPSDKKQTLDYKTQPSCLSPRPRRAEGQQTTLPQGSPQAGGDLGALHSQIIWITFAQEQGLCLQRAWYQVELGPRNP